MTMWPASGSAPAISTPGTRGSGQSRRACDAERPRTTDTARPRASAAGRSTFIGLGTSGAGLCGGRPPCSRVLVAWYPHRHLLKCSSMSNVCALALVVTA
eukprot:1092423-Prymnesium_polylepis.2